MPAAVRAIQIEEVAQRVVRVLRLPQRGIRRTLAALRARVDAHELTVVVHGVLRPEGRVDAEPVEQLEGAGESAEHIRAVNSPRDARRVPDRTDEETVLGRQEDQSAVCVAVAAERGVEQRLVPHDRAEADVAAALRGLDTELQAQALVEVADVERQRAVVVRLRGGDARLVQGADPEAKARVRVAAGKSDLRVADGTGAE